MKLQLDLSTLLGSCANNTNNSGSSTNNTSQPPPPAGGLFGSTTTTSQPAPSLFGASTTASQPQQQPSSFGSTTQAGGLFGSRPAAPAGGSLFGNQSASTGQQGGLFGAAPAQTQQGGGLFGNLNQSQPQPAAGSSLFAPSGQPQSQQTAGSTLFGNLGQTHAQQPNPVFGATQTQTQPAQQGGTFGLSINNRAPNASLFGNQPSLPPLGLGQSTQSQQTVPGVRIDVSQLRGTTRFTDLHDDLQKDLCMIDDFIHKQMSYKDQIDAVIPRTQEAVTSIAPDVNLLNGKADTVELALDNDVQSIRNLRELVKSDVEDAKLSFKSIENLKLPSQFHYQSGWQPSTAVATHDEGASGPVDIMQYFSEKANSLDSQLQRYLQQIAEIEGHLRTVEGSTLAQTEALVSRRNGTDNEDGVQGKIRNLAHTMSLFEEAIRNVASHVGNAREEVVELSSGAFNGARNSAKSNEADGSPWHRRAPAAPEPQRSRIGWS